MLSYQHGFHAGNFADLHKHLSLTLLLQALNRKAKPWSYLETHSGRGRYDLRSEQALKTAEFHDGVARLWDAELYGPIADYIDLARQVNTDGKLAIYPGSPLLASLLARADDRLHLMELHPQEIAELKRLFSRDSRVGVHHRDGYEGVLALLPPKPNRGLVLVDPAYEVKSEYQQVAGFIVKALQRWPNGCFAIWYPLLAANRWQEMLRTIEQRCPDVAIFDSQFMVDQPQERGMYGSGMLLINPPWQVDQQLDQLLPELLRFLDAPEGSIQNRWLRAPV